jgi:uncharacterized membrane protein
MVFSMMNLPALPFLIVEIGAYILALLVLNHARREGIYMVFTILGGILFGFLVEYTEVRQTHSYSYGQFLIMLGGIIPLAVCVGWGLIIYAAVETSNRLQIPVLLRPLLDGLLALSIDLNLDPIAVSLGFWQWEETGLYFGIPSGNFIGWFVVVASFSALLHLGRRWLPPDEQGLWGQAGLPLVVTPTALLLTYLIFELYERLALVDQATAVLLLIVSLNTVAVFSYWRTFQRDYAFAPFVLATPLYFHVYCIGAYIFAAIFSQSLLLALALLIVAALSLWLFTLPYSQRRHP